MEVLQKLLLLVILNFRNQFFWGGLVNISLDLTFMWLHCGFFLKNLTFLKLISSVGYLLVGRPRLYLSLVVKAAKLIKGTGLQLMTQS